MESLLHNLKRFAQVLQRIFCNLFAYNPSKEICTFLVFLYYKLGYLIICKFLCIFGMARWRAFQRCIFYPFLDIFCKHFIKWIFQKISNFANLHFLQILKVEHKSFPMMYHLAYLDIKHGNSRGGKVKFCPPPSAYPDFQVFKIQVIC